MWWSWISWLKTYKNQDVTAAAGTCHQPRSGTSVMLISVWFVYSSQEKTNAVRALAQQHREREQQQSLRQPTPPTPIDLNKSTACHPRDASGSVSPGVPTATLDLSSVNTATSPHELSTLVWCTVLCNDTEFYHGHHTMSLPHIPIKLT